MLQTYPRPKFGKNVNFVQNESTFVHNMIGKTFLSVIYSFYQHFFYLAGGGAFIEL